MRDATTEIAGFVFAFVFFSCASSSVPVAPAVRSELPPKALEWSPQTGEVVCRGRHLLPKLEWEARTQTEHDLELEGANRWLDVSAGGALGPEAIARHLEALWGRNAHVEGTVSFANDVLVADVTAPERLWLYYARLSNGCEVIAIERGTGPLQEALGPPPAWLSSAASSKKNDHGVGDLVHGVCKFFSPGRCGQWEAEKNYLDRSKP